ncbi:hypothetical protein DFJ73DRAFT_868044 [Zopfochytrium polystomum]|nr:hypothetical protein DFJ73DRAFT_868044 [Zopfochytrium polystomum]
MADRASSSNSRSGSDRSDGRFPASLGQDPTSRKPGVTSARGDPSNTVRVRQGPRSVISSGADPTRPASNDLGFSKVLLQVLYLLDSASLKAASASCRSWRSLVAQFESTLYASLCYERFHLTESHRSLVSPLDTLHGKGPTLSWKGVHDTRLCMMNGRAAFRRYFFDCRFEEFLPRESENCFCNPITARNQEWKGKEPAKSIFGATSSKTTHSPKLSPIETTPPTFPWLLSCPMSGASNIPFRSTLKRKVSNVGPLPPCKRPHIGSCVRREFVLAWPADPGEPFSACLDASLGVLCYVSESSSSTIRLFDLNAAPIPPIPVATSTFLSGHRRSEENASGFERRGLWYNRALYNRRVTSTGTLPSHGHNQPVRLLLTNNAGTLISFDESTTILVWDLPKRQLRGPLFNTSDDSGISLVYSINIWGDRAVTGHGDGKVALWDVGNEDSAKCRVCYDESGIRRNSAGTGYGFRGSAGSARPGPRTAHPEGCRCRVGSKLWEVQAPGRYANTISDSALLNVTAWEDLLAFGMYDGHFFVYRVTVEVCEETKSDIGKERSGHTELFGASSLEDSGFSSESSYDRVPSIVYGAFLDGEPQQSKVKSRRRYVGRLLRHFSILSPETALYPTMVDGLGSSSSTQPVSSLESGRDAGPTGNRQSVENNGVGGSIPGATNANAESDVASQTSMDAPPDEVVPPPPEEPLAIANFPLTLSLHGNFLLTNGVRSPICFFGTLSLVESQATRSIETPQLLLTYHMEQCVFSESQKLRLPPMRLPHSLMGLSPSEEVLRSIQFAEISRCGTMIMVTDPLDITEEENFLYSESSDLEWSETPRLVRSADNEVTAPSQYSRRQIWHERPPPDFESAALHELTSSESSSTQTASLHLLRRTSPHLTSQADQLNQNSIGGQNPHDASNTFETQEQTTHFWQQMTESSYGPSMAVVSEGAGLRDGGHAVGFARISRVRRRKVERIVMEQEVALWVVVDEVFE